MTVYGNFRKCSTRFYPVRDGAVRYKVLVMAVLSVLFTPNRQNRNQAYRNSCACIV